MRLKLFWFIFSFFSWASVHSQIDFAINFEPRSIVALKNDGQALNLTEFKFAHSYTSTGSLGINAVHKIKHSDWKIGLDIATRSYSSIFRLNYNELLPVERVATIEHFFIQDELKFSVLLNYKVRNWYFNIKYGQTFDLNPDFRNEDFLERLGVIDGEFKHFAIIQRYSRSSGGRTTELEIGTHISPRFSITARADLHLNEQSFYFLEMYSNRFYAGNNDFKKVVRINLRRHYLNIAWGINYHFTAFKKKEKSAGKISP